MEKTLIISLGLLLLGCTTTHAKHLHPERWYQEEWCPLQNGTMEVVLPDRARVDCLTDTNAVEVDFAPKWAESLGQALYYASQTERRAGILLILEKETDTRYLERLKAAIKQCDCEVDVWTTKAWKSRQ